MKAQSLGQMLKIYIGERDQFDGEPLHHAILIKDRQTPRPTSSGQ